MDDRGTHVIARAAGLLRAVSERAHQGATTTEIANIAGLARPTAHRLLASLDDEGFVDRDRATGRWYPGPELYLLGVTAAPRFEVSDRARVAVKDLARDTGESAFLSVRRGDQSVCLVREDGSFPLRSHVLYEGIRFPLGIASAGLAILSHLPDRELDRYLDDVDLVPKWGEAHSRTALQVRVRETKIAGYATNPGLIVEGSWGLAAAVFDGGGAPRWGLSLTGVETRFGESRRHELGQTLLEAAHQLTKQAPRTGS